jgi:hypothetical protein
MSDIEVKGGRRSDKREMLHRYSTINTRHKITRKVDLGINQ